MTKAEINEKIFSLKSDEEIEEFVKARVQELEDASIETTVGQNYTTTFREYISQKTHYKAGTNFTGAECPDLVYDDITPYIDLVKSIRKDDWYNELTLFTIIFWETYNYLPVNHDLFTRTMTYCENIGKRVSIKEIRDNKCAFCSEKAGLSHNMFKFLGIDSEVVTGLRGSSSHAYNIIYPRGYDNEPMVIYDPSHFVSFKSEDEHISLGYYTLLERNDYNKLMSGAPIKIDLTKTEGAYRSLYDLGEEYKFVADGTYYIAGLNNKINTENENIIDDLYHSTHLENGVESVTHKV